MPLNRYHIRNECSLADPELYRAADKDDPEALLEGVAMAGLVGVLRQLGDLAEFAAEVFHDLQEEVMATAARGHSLMVRVQQLEAEFPSIERAFPSQTNHSSFFYNAGVDWHPNTHMDQNLIARGDLPRFIMDSYEECRGPPRLFLLDKFDVAGAGACLKRYTDPSFFKAEVSDVQREKRIRRGKKKGSRWRNEETPEVLPTSRVKLHHLLLEERIENTVSDPAHPVKLKRRLNGFPFHSKTGESYMEKFLKIASPEHRVVQEISVCSSPLKLPANGTYETGLDRNDISWESPDQEFRHRRLSLTPDVDGTVQNLSMDNLKEVASDNGISESPRGNHSFEANSDLSTFYGEVREKEITVVGKTKTESSIDGYQSDDVASEVDNYVDARTTMESEMDTDSELRTKSDLQVLSSKRQISGFYASEAQQQSNLSDSQSFGSSMLSDDGNSSFKKGISSSSFSDTPSISADTMPLKGEVSIKGFLPNEIFEAKGTARPQNQISDNEDIGLALSTGCGNADAGMGVADVPAYRPDHGEQTISSLTFFPPTLAHTDADSPVREHVMEKGETEETLCACNAPKNELINDTVSETNLNISVSGDSITSDSPLRTENHSSPRLSAENQAVGGLDDKYLNVDGVLPCMSNLSDFSCNTRDALSLADFAENKHLEDLNSEENLSSSSSAYQPLDESGDINSNIMEHPPEVSPEDPLINGLDTEDPIVISGASDADPSVFSVASVHISSTIDAAPEEAKSENSMDSIPQTGAAEDGHVEYPVGNQTFLSISIMPHAEDQCHNLSLPELETHDTAMESDFIVSEPDDVIPPAAEVAVSLIPVMDSPDDFHSKDLRISGTTDKIQPLDPAANSTDDQIDSPIPVMFPAEEQSLDLTGAELETRRKVAEPDDIVPDVDDMISLSGDIAGDTKPVMESPENCNVKEPQASVITNDIPSSAHEENTVVTRYMDSNDATGVTISPDCDSLTRNVHLSEADAERDEAEAAPFTGLEEDGNQCSSLCLDLKKFDEDSLSNFRGPNQSRMEAEVCVPDCYSESDVVKEVGILEVASLDLGSDLSETLHHDHTESEVLDNVPDSYSEVESSLDLGHAATTSSLLQQIGLDTNGVPSLMSNLIGHTEDTSLLPIHHDAEEQKVELSLIRLDEEETKVLHNAVEANLESSPQLEQESSLDCLDQEGCSNTASASLLPNLPWQLSVSKLLPRKNCSVDDIGQTKDPFTISPVVGLLPEAKISVEEMPPLPPLPPVQWRMEKYQHASSAQEKDAPPSNAGAFPSLSPSIADPNGHPANSSLPHYDIAGENSPLVYEYMSHNQVQDGPVLSQVPPIVHHENNMNLLPSLGETQSVNQRLPLPGNFDAMLQIDSHVGEKENIQPSLSMFPQGTSVDTASTYASGQPHEEASQRQHQVAPETSSKDKKLDQGSAYAEGNMNTNDTDALLRVIENEQPQNVMPSPAGEIALQAQSGGKANGDRTTKVPRPRNPLIDAVVGIDKSKLRKVTERPRPQIQKVDERDSLLEQIRAKSFNLKPTVVSRPSIQGPATNLQVAAILEKAKTIRQAFAGSDEDDDEDSWSDS